MRPSFSFFVKRRILREGVSMWKKNSKHLTYIHEYLALLADFCKEPKSRFTDVAVIE